MCLGVYKGTTNKYFLHLINFNDESIQCDLSEEERANATRLDVVALKQIDRVSCILWYFEIVADT